MPKGSLGRPSTCNLHDKKRKLRETDRDAGSIPRVGTARATGGGLGLGPAQNNPVQNCLGKVWQGSRRLQRAELSARAVGMRCFGAHAGRDQAGLAGFEEKEPGCLYGRLDAVRPYPADRGGGHRGAGRTLPAEFGEMRLGLTHLRAFAAEYQGLRSAAPYRPGTELR